MLLLLLASHVLLHFADDLAYDWLKHFSKIGLLFVIELPVSKRSRDS